MTFCHTCLATDRYWPPCNKNQWYNFFSFRAADLWTRACGGKIRINWHSPDTVLTLLAGFQLTATMLRKKFSGRGGVQFGASVNCQTRCCPPFPCCLSRIKELHRVVYWLLFKRTHRWCRFAIGVPINRLEYNVNMNFILQQLLTIIRVPPAYPRSAPRGKLFCIFNPPYRI